MKKIKTISAILLMGLLLTSCGESVAKEDGHGDHEEHGPEGIVALNDLQMKTLGLKIISLQQRNMSQEIQVNGSLKLPPQERADVSPLIGGIIKKIYVIEGDHVRKGQVLATMQHPDIVQMQQDYANAVTNFEFLEKEYTRTKKLYEEKVSSAASFQKIEAEYKTSKSTIAGQKIKLAMLGLSAKKVAAGNISSTINIVSPLNGTISLIETNIGAFAQPMSKLFEVVNNSKLHADFRVYEKDINKVKVGQKVVFQSSSIDNTEFEGIIHNISPVFEENPKALHVHAEISNKQGELIPGMYINGRILANNIETTVVPDGAIVADGDKFFIFVKTKTQQDNHGHDHAEGEKAHKEDTSANSIAKKTSFLMVEVIPGIKNAGYTEIKLLNNLPKDIEIAGSAAYFLIAEMRKAETAHEH